MSIKFLVALVVGLVLALISHQAAWANEDERRNPNWAKPRVEAKVESRSDGVWIRIEVRETVPGVTSPAQAGVQPAPPASPKADSARNSEVSAGTSVDTSVSTNRGTTGGATGSAGRSW